MAELTPDLAADVLLACQQGADEAAAAMSRIFQRPHALTLGETDAVNYEAAADDWSGPGLVMVLRIDDQTALLVLPQAGGLLPDWYGSNAPSGRRKLLELAQEVGTALLPEVFAPQDVRVGRVDELAAALRQAGVEDGAGMVPITIISGERSGVMSLVWPAPHCDELLASVAWGDTNLQDTETADEEAAATARASTRASAMAGAEFESGIARLPSYARSLLKIRVPVVVTLADRRQSLSRILELGPGTIIQFDKPCEETLSLEVGNREIAVGEAVKVGEKFGLRLTSVVLPGERFVPVRPKNHLPARSTAVATGGASPQQPEVAATASG